MASNFLHFYDVIMCSAKIIFLNYTQCIPFVLYQYALVFARGLCLPYGVSKRGMACSIV